MKFTSLIFFVLFLFFAFSDPVPPTWPEIYHVDLLFSLPYANIHIPVSTDYDNTTNNERIIYYSGLTLDYYLTVDNYEIWTTQTNQTCYKNPEPHAVNQTLVGMFPDLSTWTYIGVGVARGFKCNVWEYIYQPPGYNKTNVYHFYVDFNTNSPVQYHMLGYDIVFGSHFDEYVMDYYSYIPNQVNPNAFVLPAICNNASSHPEHKFGRNSLHFKKLTPLKSSNSETLFDLFKSKYSKNYPNEKEQQERQEIFYNNYRYINEFNQEHTDMTLGVNHFADMTIEEFRSVMLMPKGMLQRKVNHKIEEYEPRIPTSSLPTNLNWTELGAVSPVKDQAFCGSCWAFSTVGVIEGQYYLATGNFKQFSEQNVIDCSWNATHPSYGCDGSSQEFAYEALMGMGGIEFEDDYPYLSVTGYCGYTPEKRAASLLTYYTIPNSEEAVIEALNTIGPLAISYDADHESMMFYSGGVYHEPTCSTTNLDHAVLLVGYGNYPGTEEPYWLVKNSWSTHWGYYGYFLIARKDNMCGITTDVTFPVLERNFAL
ncbi:hypothetical protein M0811_12460 [Anaeramoeba ignava]|uniref:Counting factor associated protein D n=1 Tax=Anaeramoeba ignava TaxID=1746090 RepID=A0A9Q0R6G6_ANAIG|nr:hypothetical protein M0811_12460 [Anaeramoeba ignava]